MPPNRPRLNSLSALYLLASFPGFVLATRSSSMAQISPSLGEDNGNGTSFFSMESMDATIFSLSIIFGVITALQLLSAAFNISKHASASTITFCNKNVCAPFALPSPANANPIPLYALGPIFPIALTLATFCLLMAYLLRATLWGIAYSQTNQDGSPPLDSESVITSWIVFTYLGNTFLAMTLFSFVCYRVRRLCYCTCRGKLHIIKRVFDMVLVFTLFALGTTYVGYRAHLINISKTWSGDSDSWLLMLAGNGGLARFVQIKRAKDAFLVVAALEIFVSAVMLYKHAEKYQSAPDRKVAMLIGTVIGPLFLAYALFTLISGEILFVDQNRQGPQGFPSGTICLIIRGGLGGGGGKQVCNPSSAASLELGRVIVTCVTLSTIIWMLLRFSGASLIDALKGRSSTRGSPQEHLGGQTYVHTHGLTYKL